MVDINLIGDDKTGEEERVDDFTQTSSMDTQELAFEERTETFDTTKTAGFAQKKSYSSIVSVLIIAVVVVLLGGSVYFFMFNGNDNVADIDIPEFDPSVSESEFATNNDDTELQALTEQLESELSQLDGGEQLNGFSEPIEEEPIASSTTDIGAFEPEPIRPEPVRSTPPPKPASRPVPKATPAKSFSSAPSGFAANSSEKIETVTKILSSMPGNLNATLLSYAGEKVRMEFVAATTSDVQGYTGSLNQYMGAGNFAVVAENQVNANGVVMEKVLISGNAQNGGGGNAAGIQFLNLGQARDAISRSAQQYGLAVRELLPQAGSFSEGYQKIPVLLRLYGSQASIISFLQDMAAQSYNIELAKILLVSPDMVNYSDENFVLVLNMFVLEQA